MLKMIPLVQEYPTWLQTSVVIWIALTALLVIFLIITPRKSSNVASQPLPVAESRENTSAPTNAKIIKQVTKGDNSPAVAGVEGNVTITAEQQKNAK